VNLVGFFLSLMENILLCIVISVAAVAMKPGSAMRFHVRSGKTIKLRIATVKNIINEKTRTLSL
jgi:hypothetical protein